MSKIDLCEHTKIRLIAAAIGHQQCTKTAACVIPLPGTGRYVAIGTPEEVVQLLPITQALPGIDLDKLTRKYRGWLSGTVVTLPADELHAVADAIDALITLARAAQPMDAAAICDGVAAKSRNSLFRSGAKICAGEIRAAQVAGDQAGARAGEAITLYRPSNGTEGEGFMSRHCYQCKHDDGGIGERVCAIIGNTMLYNVDEPGYPTEWRYGADGRPTCTKFELDSARTGADQVDSEGGHHD